MANLTIKNVPDELLERLRESAEAHRRSLNSEVILRLEEATGLRAVDVERILERARAVRERFRGAYLTEEDINRFKEEGRR